MLEKGVFSVKNAVLTFLILMTLLGVGTALLVEKYSDEQILPRSIEGFSLAELNRRFERGQRAFKRWWNKTAEKLPASGTPKAESPEKKIIKWQDERGVWHYEYAAPAESEPPALPP